MHDVLHAEWTKHAYSRFADHISIPHILEVRFYSEYVCHICHIHLSSKDVIHIQYASLHVEYRGIFA